MREPRLQDDGAHSNSAPTVSAEEVETQLQRILASPLFRNAPRHCRFLSFVVKKTLIGEAGAVKEYLIGLEVFDRDSGYDPGTDPIVRAEARRLRTRLNNYYREFGRHDAVHIDLPKGTYVPSFCRNGATDPQRPAAENLSSLSAAKPQADGPSVASARREKAKLPTWVMWGAVALTILVLGYGIHLLRREKRPASASEIPTDSNVVVLADFTNTTGDPVFDHSLRQGLSAQLEQSPFLNILSDQRIAQTLLLMSQAKDTRLSRELARDVCQRTASKATIEGAISAQDSQYLLDLQAVNCRNGEILVEQHVTAENRQQVLTALAQAAVNLRQGMGEALASVKRYDMRPENVTTASLEALQAYSLGTHAMMILGDYNAAVPLFQKATVFDPNFAMAYARMGTCYENLDQTEKASENLRHAYSLRQRVSDRERFYIDSHYYQLVKGDLVAAQATYELWSQAYPDDEVPAINLGRTYAELGDYDKSLASYQKALKLGPPTGLLYGNLVYSYLSVNRLDEARATAHEAQVRNLDSPWMHLYLYWVDFLDHNPAAMSRDVAGDVGKPGTDDLVDYIEANTAAYNGQLAKAQELTERAVASASRSDQKDSAAGYQAINSLHEVLLTTPETAKRQAKSALALSSNKEVEAIAGITLALAGDTATSSKLADNLAERYPDDTSVRFEDVPTIKAAIDLHRNNPRKAIADLASAAPYQFGRGDFIWLYPVYLRAQAYLADHQNTAAAAEFQTIISHPGAVLNEPIGSLSYLGLARAYAQGGDSARAKRAYQDFLALWKDADPQIPLLSSARIEYSELP